MITTSMAAAHISREDPPRVTASRNQLGLSLSKHIRHRLIAKINGKRRPRTYEALDRISADYSCACHTSAPIASPVPARQASAWMCFSLSSLLYTLISV
jgi:hypothetical protein